MPWIGKSATGRVVLRTCGACWGSGMRWAAPHWDFGIAGIWLRLCGVQAACRLQVPRKPAAGRSQGRSHSYTVPRAACRIRRPRMYGSSPRPGRMPPVPEILRPEWVLPPCLSRVSCLNPVRPCAGRASTSHKQSISTRGCLAGTRQTVVQAAQRAQLQAALAASCLFRVLWSLTSRPLPLEQDLALSELLALLGLLRAWFVASPPILQACGRRARHRRGPWDGRRRRRVNTYLYRCSWVMRVT